MLNNLIFRFQRKISIKLKFTKKLYYLLSKGRLKSLYLCIIYFRSKNDVFELKKKNYLEHRYREIMTSFEKISETTTQKLSIFDLSDLYQYSQLYGKFQEAYFLKKILAKKHINEKYNLDSFFLAIEAGLHSFATSFPPIKIPKLKTQRTKAQLTMYSILIRPKCNSLIPNDNMHIKYSNAIKEKNILISGPISMSDIPNEMLKKFDVHITTNQYIHPSRKYHRSNNQINISYFNHYRVESWSKEVVSACEYLDWAVLGSNKTLKKLKKKLPKCSKTQLRSTVAGTHNLFVFAELMGLQRILRDLLYFPVGKIFLSNFSFHVDLVDDYDPHYKPQDIPADVETLLSDCRLHDAVGNFSFTKYLFDQGLIICDQAVSSILNMSVEEYAKHLDKRFNLNNAN